MLKKFLKHRGGNFAIMTSIAIIPIMGGLALGIDYTIDVATEADHAERA